MYIHGVCTFPDGCHLTDKVRIVPSLRRNPTSRRNRFTETGWGTARAAAETAWATAAVGAYSPEPA